MSEKLANPSISCRKAQSIDARRRSINSICAGHCPSYDERNAANSLGSNFAGGSPWRTASAPNQKSMLTTHVRYFRLLRLCCVCSLLSRFRGPPNDVLGSATPTTGPGNGSPKATNVVLVVVLLVGVGVVVTRFAIC